KRPDIHLSRSDLKFRPALGRRLLFIGLPMALQFSITAIGTIIVQAVTNTLGSAAVAAVTAANKSQAFLTTPMESLGVAMATYCGQNLGAGRMDRVKKGYWSSVAMGMLFCAVAIPISIFLGRYVSLLFLDAAETAILNDVAVFLFWNAIFYPSLEMVYISRNCVQGLGYSVPAMAAGILELVGRAVSSLILVDVFEFVGIALAGPIAWILAIAFLIPTYHVVVSRLQKHIPHPAKAG
ncbi:MAG: MATE family efflux transporter, partial [Clostridia bacterium]|nr:MATE family efflux transporter [Clostridia bacterium]